MNIVFLSPESVYPCNTGGRIVVYNKIKYLSKLGHKIFLFCITDSNEEIEHQFDEMSKYCCFQKYYNRNANKIKKYINSFFLPFAVGSRTISILKKNIEETLEENNIDLIWCEMPQMAQNIRKTKKNIKTKIILSQQNIEYLSMKSLAKTFNNPIKKIIYSVESLKFKYYERKLYTSNLFDSYVFVSSDDKNRFETDFPFVDKPLKLVPIGAEKHQMVKRNQFNNCIIVGKMSYPPNVEGVIWFYNNVWPIVKEQKSESHLYIIGKDPDERILAINDNSITVTGTVDSVEPYYNKASVAIIPVFSGGGVKTKLIEAASYGIPVVTTASGAAGTEFKDSIHISICDNPETFAKEVVCALNNNEKSIVQAHNAYEYFINNYTWDGICKNLSDFIIQLSSF